jgi:hypothetical protein
VLSANDVWAVGTGYQGYQGNPYYCETLILHWDGKSWTKVPSPSPGGISSGPAPAGEAPLCAQTSSELSAVSAISPTDIWAVGSYVDPTTGVAMSLILHWDGDSWTQVPSPNPGGGASPGNEAAGMGGNWLTAVSALSSDDVWGVGDYTSKTASTGEETLVVHWNGESWSQVPSLNPGVGESVLASVLALSDTDVWAGGDMVSGNNQYFSLMEHWDGENWSQVPVPGTSTLVTLAAATPQDVWTAGTDLVLNWNGSNWNQVAVPLSGVDLNSILVTSATERWVVGDYEDQNELVVLHGQSNGWTQVQVSPNDTNPSDAQMDLESLGEASPNSIWAVGCYPDSSTGYVSTLVLHWDGHSWQKA